MLLLVLHVGLAVGPVLDPIEGATMTEAERKLLPSGGHAASVADLWVLEWVNLRPSGGGLALFDAPAVATRGWSWTQTRYRLNDLDITDPALSGEPLLQMPHSFWQQTHFASLWTDAPSINWELAQGTATPTVTASTSWGRWRCC